MLDNLDQIPPDALADLGLVHKYPLHIDVVNNETGFGLYIETPDTDIDDEGWVPLFGLEEEGWVRDIHVDDYVAGMAPEYETDNWYLNLKLRIREVHEDGTFSYWRNMELSTLDFAKNSNPPDALEDAGFNRFDSVTWIEGLEPDKDYQVQVWFEVDGYAGINAEGHYVRKSWRVYEDSEDEVGTLVHDDYYRWQEADIYSGIHTINTDPEAFNVDIDNDGDMDFFIDDLPAHNTGAAPDSETGSPPAVTGFSVQTTSNQAIMTWDVFPDAVTRDNIGQIQIFLTRSATPPDSSLLGGNISTFPEATGFTYNVDNAGQYWYWIRYVSKDGNAGPFTGQDGVVVVEMAAASNLLVDDGPDLDGAAAPTGLDVGADFFIA